MYPSRLPYDPSSAVNLIPFDSSNLSIMRNNLRNYCISSKVLVRTEGFYLISTTNLSSTDIEFRKFAFAW